MDNILNNAPKIIAIIIDIGIIVWWISVLYHKFKQSLIALNIKVENLQDAVSNSKLCAESSDNKIYQEIDKMKIDYKDSIEELTKKVDESEIRYEQMFIGIEKRLSALEALFKAQNEKLDLIIRIINGKNKRDK
ncbi:MAG: hypothetical protein RBR14_06480 [Candidatus Cloacimonas acidaminovorans]|nr:hypothetical protein [Candidatus Cloacimonas acidaminovorans]